ncbi:hypothetical protein D8823_02060 [Streptococcus gordonii]|nr:hypothetical protein D8823_02060 [Streptococcus gordonii]
MPFGKENTQKRRLLYSLLEKDQDNKNILYTDRDLGDELWLLSSSTTVIAVYLSFPKRWLSVKKFSLQRIVKERWHLILSTLVYKIKNNGSGNTKMATGLFSKNRIRRISFAKTRQNVVSQFCLVFIICFCNKVGLYMPSYIFPKNYNFLEKYI